MNQNSKSDLGSLRWTHVLVELDLEKSKLALIGIIFIFMSLMGLVSIILLPDILAVTGFQITGLPEPDMMFVLSDFYNDSLIYYIIIIFYGMGIFSSETDNNKPIYFKLSRPVSRRTYYLTRTLIRIFGIFTLFTISGLVVHLAASLYYDPFPFEKILIASMVNSLGLTSILAVVILGSAKYRASISASFGISFIISQIFLNVLQGAFDWIKWLDPMVLVNTWPTILDNSINTMELVLTFVALILWVFIPILIGLRQFENRDI